MAWLDPITRKRLRRFRAIRRAWGSLWLLAGVFLISLLAPLLANDRPLLVRLRGEWIAPVRTFYPSSHFHPAAGADAPDYRALARDPLFSPESGNRMVWPLLPYGPHQVVKTESLRVDRIVTVHVRPAPRVATLNVDAEGRLSRTVAAGSFFGVADEAVDGLVLGDHFPLPESLQQAVRARLANQAAPGAEAMVRGKAVSAVVSLPEFKPRSSAPRTVRLTARTAEDETAGATRLVLHEDGRVEDVGAGWATWPEAVRKPVAEWAAAARTTPVENQVVEVGGRRLALRFDPLRVAYPFQPSPGHALGLDHSGRDVLVRILYATRIGLSFAFLLTLASTLLGVLIGSVQGYFGGWVDLAGQRFTEIWGSLPFLYVIILLSSVFGRSFLLLLGVYTVFNWIGMAAYIRAEYLRLRKQPFVESAVCLGARTSTILFRHILPNALTPVITLFPFLFVGAIASINALDYLGYGMPAGTPSFGELLNQAQDHRHAWWLTLYPSLSLFLLMLLGVFIGDGLRAAFDPRVRANLE